MSYQIVIGLEVHVQLSTQTKAFCGCSNKFGQEANTQVCPICLGFPGVLPVLNKTALEYAIKAGLALNCTVQGFSRFDRKHYYYPDLPKNYQISQYEFPICKAGYVDIGVDSQIKRIRIRRVHLEEDAGKLIHLEDFSLVDYNRAGTPLLEIVSEPDISSADEAYEYLMLLKSVLKYLEISDCDMEKGSLRCDANISVRPKEQKELGVKTELKNMNSFKAVKEALDFEAQRQISLLKEGKAVIQETRLWDAKSAVTISMRSKEEAKDYRYFPEPDIPPFYIHEEDVLRIKQTIPELPQNKLVRFMKEYSLRRSDALILVAEKKDADYAEECLSRYPKADKRNVVNWLIGPLASEANERGCLISDLNIPAERFLELIGCIDDGLISQLAAKSVLKQMLKTQKNARDIIREENLEQISDISSLMQTVDAVIKENPKSSQDYQNGKTNALMFLVGQVMKKTQGKANPKLVQDMIKERLKSQEA